ncbi:hypothetical protein RhiXN_01596 [Rhizoctonia solani]|uniref:Borealin N-terminal domain-containing protein n=1 Tax=Rhizoctonia solani TaxID=456999 RepID=A0A8H8P7H7_9AGAM|nr:uncharacterized protein RhiXN_01596 [Rhizoctonia solani]QRW27001.1 hypothetical protein RhiXN_01596 [Rhizoctonia solani]
MPVLVIQNDALASNMERKNTEHYTPGAAAAQSGASTKPTRRFTEEEKAQLLENFDLEVADRVARMRTNVTDILERFLIRQENEVTRIPRALRSLTVGEFADKYNGSISECLQGMAQARLESTGDADLAGGKRKWQASQNTETAAVPDKEGSRAPKAARKVAPPSSAVRRIVPAGSRTPSANRTLHSNPNPNPNPTPSRPRLNATPLRKAPALSRTTTVPASPFRGGPSGTQPGYNATTRSVSQPVIPTASTKPPTSATFAPVMPPSAPLTLGDRDEANRCLVSTAQQFSIYYFTRIRHPSASSTSTLVSYDVPSSTSSTLNSQHSAKHLTSAPSTSQSQLDIPRTPSKIRRTASALVMLPTTSGEVLELDPLVASPGAVDALEGISDSAKKMAKEEMVRFVTEAVAKWNVKIS